MATLGQTLFHKGCVYVQDKFNNPFCTWSCECVLSAQLLWSCLRFFLTVRSQFESSQQPSSWKLSLAFEKPWWLVVLNWKTIRITLGALAWFKEYLWSWFCIQLPPSSFIKSLPTQSLAVNLFYCEVLGEIWKFSLQSELQGKGTILCGIGKNKVTAGKQSFVAQLEDLA